MNKNTQPSQSTETKLCPHCQKEIQNGAKKCPECQSDLRNWLNRHPILSLLAFFLIVPTFVAAVLGESSSTSVPQKTPEELASEQKALEKWQATPAGKLCAKHADWPREDCDKIADRKIWVGMKYEMLTYLRGKPNSINPSNYGNGTKYQYCWNDYTPSCFYDQNNDGIIDAYN